MMKRPFYLTFMMGLHAVLILSLLIQISWLYQHHMLFDLQYVWHKLSDLNKLMILFFSLSIPLYASASRALCIILPINFFLVGFNNWSVSHYGQDFSFWQTSGATLLYVIANLNILSKNNFKFILNPSLRWWRTSKRHPLCLPVTLKTSQGQSIETHTFDLSKTGAFIKSQSGLECGEKITLEISTPSGPFTFHARIIRKSPPQGHYPAGIGVRFFKVGVGGRLFLEKISSIS